MHVAHTTGDDKYLGAAILLHDWSELQVSRADGSWINDVTLSPWQGITVFHTIALAESLHHHGSLLDAAIRAQWTDRLARAAKFLDGFITIETGNINYPITASLAFALCGQVLGEHRYLARARALAHTSLDYFTPNGLLFGEGHPLHDVTLKGCHPVDLGYNVGESLPALAQYSLLTNDHQVLEQTVKSLRAHMEFMLRDGASDPLVQFKKHLVKGFLGHQVESFDRNFARFHDIYPFLLFVSSSSTVTRTNESITAGVAKRRSRFRRQSRAGVHSVRECGR
jgi:hypothetical protein